MNTRRLLIVHHTHWDREWYRSFADFRFRLLRATEHVVSLLEDNSLEGFLFDGQTSVIEDVGAVAGESLKRSLHSLIREGRIEVGPWYIMPDEFLVSGEAILRNLEIGIAQSRKLGSSPEILYLPDTFGHISQLPAIARMFGLKSILLARGVNRDVSDLLWTGADGSKIHTHALPLWSGYYQDFLHADDFTEQTDRFISQCREYSSGAPVLLPAGSDHSMPPADWKERALRLREHLSGHNPPWEMKETRLSQALEELRNFHTRGEKSEDTQYPGTLAGELRDNGKAYILSGVLSSRVDLKRANVDAQDALSYQLEPLGYFASGDMLYSEHRNFLWKTLIQNHAHDSIGGCSIDEVHRENHVRFQQVRSGALRHMHDITRRLAGRTPGVFNTILVLWNQLPYSRETAVRSEVIVPENEDRGSISLWEAETPLDLQIISREKTEGFFSEFEYPVNWYPGWKYTVEFLPRLRGMECRQFRIVPCAPERDSTHTLPDVLPEASPEALAESSRGSAVSVMENQHLRVEIAMDGRVDLVNTATGLSIPNALALVWEHDDGDTYTSSPRESGARWGSLVSIEPVIRNRFSSRCSLRFCGFDDSEVELKLSLSDNEELLRVGVEIDNRSRDTRIRLVSGRAGSSRTSFSDTPFDVVKREHRHVRPHSHIPQREAYPNEWPSSSFIAAGGVSICHNGFHGYDLLDDGRVAVNLLRAVGMLSKAELPERGGGAGPHIETPEAQLQQEVAGEIGIFPGVWDSPVLTALKFRVSPLFDQGVSPAGAPELLEINNQHIILSALYRMGNELCFLRIWNSSDSPQEFNPGLPPGSRLKRFTGNPLTSVSTAGEGPDSGMLDPPEADAVEPDAGAQAAGDVDLPVTIGPREIAAFLLISKETAE